MKLSDAMQNIIGVCDKTAWNMWKPGELDAYNPHSAQQNYIMRGYKIISI
jgi:hypothetical protein